MRLLYRSKKVFQGKFKTGQHITAVQKAGLTGLDENAKVEYELETQRGKTAAVDLKLIG